MNRGATVEENVEIAKRHLTPARFESLKGELKKRYPALTDTDLEGFGIRWTERWPVTPDGGKANRAVTVAVIMDERAGIDAAAVVETAARILDAEINGPDKSGISTSPR